MSRIGKLPIKIPSNVNIIYKGRDIIVQGQFGTLEKKLPKVLKIKQNENTLSLILEIETRKGKALHGLYRTLINNMVIGVSEQFELKLNLNGIGYRATLQENLIILNLGYSHPVEINIPNEISAVVEQNTIIILKACNKEKLGLFAAKIRSWRKPEPYNGKGILYANEIIQRKAGKSGKK